MKIGSETIDTAER